MKMTKQQSVAILLSERLSQLSHEVAVGPCVQRIPVPGHRRPPVGEAFMVLCGQHHVPEGKALDQGDKGAELSPVLTAKSKTTKARN